MPDEPYTIRFRKARTMTEDKVVDWQVKAGDTVKNGDELVGIEIEKITNICEAPASGVFRCRVAQDGTTLPVGVLIGVIADTDTRPRVPSYDYSLFGSVKNVPLDNIRQIIGRRMTANWQNVPHVTHHEEVDITDLEKLRHTRNETHGKTGQKLSPLSFIIKACVAGLKAFPDVNSSLDVSGKLHFGLCCHCLCHTITGC